MQASVAAHAWPQVMQCRELVIRFAHSGPHIVKPVAQVQTPAAQAPPAPQSVVHAPQWETLVIRSRQPVPQSVRVPVHSHMPPTQA